MKKLLIGGLMAIAALACEKQDPWERKWPSGTLTDGFCISFGDSIILNHEDIDCYDFSTHFIYLKEPFELLGEPARWDLADMAFTVYAGKIPVYSGNLWPAYRSSMPGGPFIQWPSFYPPYVIGIGYMSYLFTAQPDTLEDPRASRAITDALKSYGQYREGLSVPVGNITLGSAGDLTFSFTVTNGDDGNYYILSPDKMGLGMFHYFTNGLCLYNQDSGWLVHLEEVISPEPWDSWDAGWLELLEGHSSRTYTITYDQFDKVPPGQYDAFFRFPGLHHVEQSEIERSDGRIWLGEISFTSRVTLN